jgi:SagB-type dehydrogenase family enzyme
MTTGEIQVPGPRLDEMLPLRQALKSQEWANFGTMGTPQQRGVPPPPLEKPAPPGAPLFDLVAPAQFTSGSMPLIEAIAKRRSRRTYTEGGLTLEELSFLLWSCQGIEKVANNIRAFRTVPSAGCRHPFETYILVNRVEGLAPALYRYLPVENKVCLVNTAPGIAAEIHAASGDQFVLESAATFIWTVIPYRTEWRYLHHSHRVILMDIGHACQNLYLAAESIGCGTCAIGAYDQEPMDAALGVDGEEEFTIYMAPIGRVE